MDYVHEHLSESKRKSRNLSEKKRRDAFNSLVTELAVLVTGIERRLDKSNVLKQTIAFLKRHNQLQADCVSSEEIDHSRPSFLSADEYFRLLLDSLEAFLFVVEIGDDGDSAVICYVSENANCRFGLITEQLRGKSLFSLLDQENEALLRDTFRSKLNEANGRGSGKLEVASSTGFLRFTCSVATSEAANSPNEKDLRNVDLSVTARFKALDASSSPVCLCLAKPMRIVPNSSSTITLASSLLISPEFVSRMDVEWRFIFVDSSVAYLLGYDPLELLGTSLYDYCHLDDLNKLADSHEQLKTRTDCVTSPYRFRTKSEKFVWIRTRFYITYHEWNSKPEFIVGTSCLLNNSSPSQQDTNGEPKFSKTLPVISPRGWRSVDPEKETSNGLGSDSNQVQHNRQIFRPQPGVSIEHAPISRATPISKLPPAKKAKSSVPVGDSPQDETAQALSQMNERMLWELLEKRQSNLQEKILEHQQELRRLQEQLFSAVPLLSSSSPVSSNGTTDVDISPASSSLSPAAGPPTLANCTPRPSNNGWPQHQPSTHLYPGHIWPPKCFEGAGGNPFSM